MRKPQVEAGCRRESEPGFDLHARCAVLMDASSGRILYGKEENLALPMASTTKIMTCILALEKAKTEDYSDLLTVSAYAAGMPDVQLGMCQGEKYQLKDLLYSLMLESHNDSAVAIAEYIGGSVEKFARLMNEKARSIGCRNTFFITPNGLDASAAVGTAKGQEKQAAHSSSAADMARILCYCIMQSPKSKDFLDITRCPGYSFHNMVEKDQGWQAGSRSFTCYNHNAFLNMMDGALTGKTGFTANAGYCYVGALRQGERTFVIALLACGWPGNRTWKWQDAKRLFGYGLKHYQQKEVTVPADFALPDLFALKGADGSFRLDFNPRIETELVWKNQSMLVSDQDRISHKFKLKKEFPAPVRKGEELGSLCYYINGKKILTFPVLAKNNVPARDFEWFLQLVFRRFFAAF